MMARPLIHDPRQIDLEHWLGGNHRHGDPATSVKAARRVDVKKLNQLIMRALHLMGGLTTEELAKVIRAPLQSVTPRMRPLVKRGAVNRTHRTRKGRTGRDRIVWEAVDASPF